MRGADRTGRWRLPALATALLIGCAESGAPDDARPHSPEPATVAAAAEALAGAHVPALDPASLNDAEIRKVIGSRPHCLFRYTSSGRPVAVAASIPDGSLDVGVVKLNGRLVPLKADHGVPGLRGSFVLVSDPVRVTVQPYLPAPAEPGEAPVDAQMVFEVGQALRVGYAGYAECRPAPAAAATNP
jgi:hypothetical protein